MALDKLERILDRAQRARRRPPGAVPLVGQKEHPAEEAIEAARSFGRAFKVWGCRAQLR